MGEIVPNQLFVAGYSRAKIANEEDIKSIFKKYGNIKEIAYKGSYSFVTFSSESEAVDALKALNGQQINGQKLKVDVVDNRKGRRNGPQEIDECFKCKKGGHWFRARECPNVTSPKRRRHSNSRSRRHRRSKRSNSRSHSYSSQSSSHSRRRRDSKKRNRQSRRSRSPRRDYQRKKSTNQKRSNSNSKSRSSVSNKQRQSHKSSSSK